MIGLHHAVQIARGVERQFLVGIHVDHRPIAQRTLQPDAHGTVNVVAPGWSRSVTFVMTADENAHEHLVILFVHDDLTDATVVSAEQDAKLELADIAFAEPERVT